MTTVLFDLISVVLLSSEEISDAITETPTSPFFEFINEEKKVIHRKWWSSSLSKRAVAFKK